MTDRSLTRTLLWWIAPALVVLVGGAMLLAASTANHLADSAYDRSLAGAIRAIEMNISTDGGLSVELPYPLFESFELTAAGEVYFRISTDDGLVLIGDTFLPAAPRVEDGAFRFYNAEYLGVPVRVGAFRSPLSSPLYGETGPESLLIEVAESTLSRDAFRLGILRDAALLNVVFVCAVILLLIAGLRRALRPLVALRTGFDRRAPDDLSPVASQGLPQETRPLIDAFNNLLARHGRQAAQQRQFLDDASHQLKTPIAVLRTQIDYALRAPEAGRLDALTSMRGIAERAGRTTDLFLGLARARNFAQAGAAMAPVALDTMLRELARMHLAAARRKRIDLALDLPDAPVTLNAAEGLLFEAVGNLIDNAIRLSPKGGTVTITACDGDPVRIVVTDQGPGMDDARLARVGDRFFDGTGLGLAIVGAVAEGHGGSFSAQNLPQGGLGAEILMPRKNNSPPPGK